MGARWVSRPGQLAGLVGRLGDAPEGVRPHHGAAAAPTTRAGLDAAIAPVVADCEPRAASKALASRGTVPALGGTAPRHEPLPHVPHEDVIQGVLCERAGHALRHLRVVGVGRDPARPRVCVPQDMRSCVPHDLMAMAHAVAPPERVIADGGGVVAVGDADEFGGVPQGVPDGCAYDATAGPVSDEVVHVQSLFLHAP